MQPKRSPLEKLQQSWQTAFSNENRDFTLEAAKVLISAFGVLATIFAGVGLYLTYRTGQEQLESAQQERQLNSERLVTDRFAKAVEQLGSPDIDVRIGAVYSLERIAKDSPNDHWTIMEVLMGFVRNKSPLLKHWKPDSKQGVTNDVQAALTVIGRRNVKHDPEHKFLDLRLSNLSFADFDGTDFSVTNFFGANLYGAVLSYAELTNGSLRSANLKGANLKGTILNGTDLSNADLTETFDLTPEQIKDAQNWQTTHYDPAFRQQLGLPPEKP